MKKQIMKTFVLFLLCLLSACGANDKEQLSVYRTLDDLSGKKVAVFTGCFQEAIVEKDYPEVEVMRIDSPTDMAKIITKYQYLSAHSKSANLPKKNIKSAHIMRGPQVTENKSTS